MMQKTTEDLTAESVLTMLGYPDPMTAARHQARMLLLGRLAHFEAAIRDLESRQSLSLEQLRERYAEIGREDFTADDDYLEWQWYADAIEATKAQLAAVS